MVYVKEREYIVIKMVIFILEIGRKKYFMEKVAIYFRQENDMKVN